MKKKLKIIIIIMLSLIFLFPVKITYKDGGTIKYCAVLYSVTKQHSLTEQGGTSGYDAGTKVRVLFFEVFDNVKFVSDNDGGIKIEEFNEDVNTPESDDIIEIS